MTQSTFEGFEVEETGEEHQNLVLPNVVPKYVKIGGPYDKFDKAMRHALEVFNMYGGECTIEIWPHTKDHRITIVVMAHQEIEYYDKLDGSKRKALQVLHLPLNSYTLPRGGLPEVSGESKESSGNVSQ
jgi:hypothetical protein